MNLPRLRELAKAWQDGTIREVELAEIRDVLPEVLSLAEFEQRRRHAREAIVAAHKHLREATRAAELQDDRKKICDLIAGRETDMSWSYGNRLKSFNVLPFRWFSVRP